MNHNDWLGTTMINADDTTWWFPLWVVKESNPVESAEYAVATGLAKEPAFAWWVLCTLHKQDHIIKKEQSQYWKHTNKYGVELPHNVEEALEIDHQAGTDFWQKAIEKEMENV